MCKLLFKNVKGSFSDTDEEWFVETVYYEPIYTKSGIIVETNMPTMPLMYPTFKNRSWRREKKLIKMWMK